METIKTAVVVVLLLAVLYGVYVVLNRPDLGPSTEPVWDPNHAAPPEIDDGTLVEAYAAPGLPEMPSRSVGQDDQEKAQASVTDQVPTPAEPPFGTGGEATAPPGLTPIMEEPGSPGETDLQDPKGPSEYESSVKRAAGLTLDDPEDDQKPPLSVGDETEDTVGPQPNRVFQNRWDAAAGQLEKEQWGEALLTLSLIYHDPDVTGEARSRLIDLLDPLAGKVIYSNEHTLEPPYEVQLGDTLQDIADRHQVPMILLQNINGIQDPNSLQPGTQLKVLSGPFRAEVDRKQSELVLFLNSYYAGRFNISIGNDPEPGAAEYTVKAKQPGREYFAHDGTRIPAKAPENPYGDWWVHLGGDMCVHGSAEEIPTHGSFGCVSLSSADAADVYHILSVGSRVVIR